MHDKSQFMFGRYPSRISSAASAYSRLGRRWTHRLIGRPSVCPRSRGRTGAYGLAAGGISAIAVSRRRYACFRVLS